jgi:PAS domain S-box-containing protein
MSPASEVERRRSDNFAIALLASGLAIFLALAGWWVFDELTRARAARELIHANYQQMIATQRVFSLVQDAETGTRGYALTGKEEFLEPYGEAVTALPRAIADLKTLYRGETAQLGRLAKLEALVNDRLVILGVSVQTRRTQGLDGVHKLTTSTRGRGRMVMNEIRDVVAAMTLSERAQIQTSLAQDRARADRTENIVTSLFLSLIFGAFAAILLTRRYLSVRQNLLSQAEAEAYRQRAVFDAAMDGIVVLDAQGRIERANPAAQRIFQRPLSGQDLTGLLDAVARDQIRAILQERSGESIDAVRREATALRPDQSTFPVEISIAGISDGSSGGMLVFVRDISERREIDRMKDEFVSTVSHELRTPLTSIAGSLGLIVGGAAGVLPDKAARLVSIAQSNSQRLVRLINDVLDIEKLESGKLPFDFQAVDLGDVAIRAIESVRGYADQLGVDLTLEVARAAPVRGDMDRLVQVATNLLSNAAKYSPKGGAVRVRVSREGEHVRLSVSDSGPGVPQAFRDRIFSRFAQADASDARGKSGTGLGLYIAKEIAERHGGRLWFDNPPEGGAVFCMDLPLSTREALQTGARDRVLLVEDEPAAQALLTAILEHEGLKVDAAGTLAEAREHLRDAGRYGAMVLDLRLPDGDGMDLMREIRARPDTRAVPIVVVSAEASRGRDPSAKTFDVVEWMEKPVDPDRLAELVRDAVGAKGQGGAVILHIDDDRDIRELVATALSGVGEILSAEGLLQARAILAERRPDLVVLDLELRDGSGLDLLEDLRHEPGPPIPVIVFSAQDTGDLGEQVTAVLVKSKTSLAGLVGAIRKTVAKPEAVS